MHRAAASRVSTLSCVASPALCALATAQRGVLSVGGRRSPLGHSRLQGKTPRIKQGTHDSMAQRIPGTTKVRYTNAKGRTFTFSIPVSQLTHPPVHRRGASGGSWHEIDTSFSDVGDLEDDMPTAVGERLAALSVGSGNDAVVEVNVEQLRGLHSAFVQLCKDYVLMDTNGMKTSMTYAELNTGPDYEHYDRKTRRRRHWIALRHRFDDVRELLWPTDAGRELAQEQHEDVGVKDREASEEEGASAPLLSLTEMMEALTWVEAASTFAVRTHRPYDTADASEFAELDLSREVRVVAECIAAVGPSQLLGRHGSSPAAVSSAGEGLTPPSLDEQRAAADRFISFAALCTKHGVPLSVAFTRPSAAPPPAESGDASSAAASRPSSLPETAAAVHQWLSAMPTLPRVKDAVRVMSVLQSLQQGSGVPSTASATPFLTFSSDSGAVTSETLLHALCRLASPSLFSHAAALENVDEEELCVLMGFVTAVQEQNAAFLRGLSGAADHGDRHAPQRQTLQHLTQLALTRCRQLLYKTGGPRTSLLSGDEDNIPLVDLQAFADHHHPAVRVHTKIGMANAQGLRYASLHSPTSAALAELLGRIEDVNGRLAPSTHGLRGDLLQHVAHKAALGKAKLDLEEVTRALPLLAEMARQTSVQQVRLKFDRLFAAMSTSIGVALQQQQQQQPHKAAQVVALLEGLAMCHYVPASYKQLEMVTLRLVMRGALTLRETASCVLAMARLVGPRGVSQAVQQAVAMRVVTEVEQARDGAARAAPVAEVLGVLRALRFCLYPSFPSLLLLVSQSPMAAQTEAWPAEVRVRYGVLLTHAAGALSGSSDDAAVVQGLSDTARSELVAGLSGPPAVEALKTEEDWQEALTASAALQLAEVRPALAAWSQAGPSPRPVHALCTPLLAVSTMEAMEAMQLSASTWYAAYEGYLRRALELMVSDAPEQRGGQGLLEDDAHTVERTLYLSAASETVRQTAATLLETEVRRLDALLSGASPAGESGLPVFSFQQRAMHRQAETTAVEERLLRYCAALKRDSDDGAPGQLRASA